MHCEKAKRNENDRTTDFQLEVEKLLIRILARSIPEMKSLGQQLTDLATGLQGIEEGLSTTREYQRCLLAIADLRDRMATSIQNNGDRFSEEDMKSYLQELNHLLNSHSCVRIPAEGQKFNARFHRAVETQAADTPEQHQVILTEIRPGYLHRRQILRTAEVIVCTYKTPTKEKE